jgi:hypothetical protein
VRYECWQAALGANPRAGEDEETIREAIEAFATGYTFVVPGAELQTVSAERHPTALRNHIPSANEKSIREHISSLKKQALCPESLPTFPLCLPSEKSLPACHP